MKFMKKNQVVVAVIGLMLIAAGYLNFTNNNQLNSDQLLETSTIADSEQMASIGDAKLVNSKPINKDDVVAENKISENSVTENVVEENNQISQVKKDETSASTQTSAAITTDEYFTKSRLERETMYSQIIESYQKILNNTSVSADQKAISQTEIKKINDLKNSIMICENLIKTKGISDVVIFVNDKSINVIVKADTLEQDTIAQIQNIIAREMNAEIENIHISNK